MSLLCLLLAACAPPLSNDHPSMALTPGWLGPRPAPGAPRLMDAGAWWQAFRDPALDHLIALALDGSPTLDAARARAVAAAAAAGQVPGAVTLGAGLGAAVDDGTNRAVTREATADAALDLLFDPGRSRAAQRAAARARADLAAAQAAGAQLFLTGEIAGAYLDYRHAQRRLVLAQGEAARQRQTLALAERLETAGQATRLETLRSRARLASLSAELPGLSAAVASGRVRLAVLAGRLPGGLPPDLAAALASARSQPRATLAPDPGIPADLLRNRPDLRAAEAAYVAARADLGSARAALWPRLSLSGTIELTADLDGGGSRSTVSLGPALRLPAFPDGPARAGVAAREAGMVAAHADWRAAVLGALAEVETALLDYRAAAQTEAAAERAVALHAEAARLTRDLAAAGEATLGELIDREAEQAQAETAQAAARLARARGFVALNLRLGGGTAPPRDVSVPPPSEPPV
jgi:multidrug efflux system outer membrane protein